LGSQLKPYIYIMCHQQTLRKYIMVWSFSIWYEYVLFSKYTKRYAKGVKYVTYSKIKHDISLDNSFSLSVYLLLVCSVVIRNETRKNQYKPNLK